MVRFQLESAKRPSDTIPPPTFLHDCLRNSMAFVQGSIGHFFDFVFTARRLETEEREKIEWKTQ